MLTKRKCERKESKVSSLPGDTSWIRTAYFANQNHGTTILRSCFILFTAVRAIYAGRHTKTGIHRFTHALVGAARKISIETKQRLFTSYSLRKTEQNKWSKHA